MSQFIEVPGQGNVEFPDDMSDDQIARAIGANKAAAIRPEATALAKKQADIAGYPGIVAPSSPGPWERAASEATQRIGKEYGPMAGTLAKHIIPQTKGAAIATGIMGVTAPVATGVAQSAVRGVVNPILQKVAPALARIVAGTGAGATAAAVDEEDIVRGALAGGAVTGAIEAGAPVVGKLIRSLPWMKGLIARSDARRIGETIGDIVPELGAPRTAAEMQNIGRVYGAGKEKLSGLFQSLEREIGDRVITVPSITPDPITVSQALKELTRAGARGYAPDWSRIDPMVRTSVGMDARALRERMLEDIRSEIGRLAPPGAPTPNRGLALPPAGETTVAGPPGRYAGNVQMEDIPRGETNPYHRLGYGPESYDIPRPGQELTIGPGEIRSRRPYDVRRPSEEIPSRWSRDIPSAAEVGNRRAAGIPAETEVSRGVSTAIPGSRRVAIIDGKTGRVIGYGQEGAGGLAETITSESPYLTGPVAETRPDYLGVYDQARQAYRKGIGITDMLESGRMYSEAAGRAPRLNTPQVQRYVSENRGELRSRLGDRDFNKLVDAVYRGGKIGERDVLVPGEGGPFSAIMSWLRGQNTGATQALRVPVATALPNLGSQYAGRAPFSPPEGLKAVLDILGIVPATSGREQVTTPHQRTSP